MIEFRPLTLADRPLFEERLHETKQQNCETAFSNLYMWRDLTRTTFADVEGCLYVRVYTGTRWCLLQPIGSGRVDVLDRLRGSCCPQDCICLRRVDETTLPRLRDVYGDRLLITEKRDAADYLHRTESLAELSGKEFRQKRGHFNRFCETYPGFTVEPLRAEHAQECLAFCRRWQENLPEDARGGAEDEYHALQRGFEEMENLSMEGILIRVDGVLAGFAAGCPHHTGSDTFVLHFEKGHTDYSGVYTALSSLFARTLQGRFAWINREEDMGLEGLRKSKLSYHPEKILLKYKVVLEK